jgi:hypothetical protein
VVCFDLPKGVEGLRVESTYCVGQVRREHRNSGNLVQPSPTSLTSIPKARLVGRRATVRAFCMTDIAGAFLKCFYPLNSMTHTRYEQDACYDQQISEQHCPAERLVEKKDRAGRYQRIRHRSHWEGQ